MSRTLPRLVIGGRSGTRRTVVRASGCDSPTGGRAPAAAGQRDGGRDACRSWWEVDRIGIQPVAGFQDARLIPRGKMTPDQVADWTDAIDKKMLPTNL